MTPTTRTIARRAAIAAAPTAAIVGALAKAGSSMQDLIVITMVIGLLVVVIVAPLTTYPLGRRRLRRLVLAGGATYLATMTASLIAFAIGTLIASASAALIAAAAAMLAGGYTLGVIFGLAAITLLRSSRPNQPSPTSNTDSASSLT